MTAYAGLKRDSPEQEATILIQTYEKRNEETEEHFTMTSETTETLIQMTAATKAATLKWDGNA